MELWPIMEAEIIGRSGEFCRVEIPLVHSSIAAGFPSPAEDYVDRALDLNELLVTNPPATFFVRVTGDSMIGAGIHHGDILSVDRSEEAHDGSIVIALINGELTVKELSLYPTVRLIPHNPAYPIIELAFLASLHYFLRGVILRNLTFYEASILGC